MRIKDWITGHPLLIFFAAAIGAGVFKYAKQQLIHFEASWLSLLAIVVLHALELISISLAIASAIFLFRRTRNQTK